MTETTAPAATATASAPAVSGLDPLTAAAAPIRATFTAVMAPYVTGDAPAPAELFAILLEAVSAAEPSADLVAGLCRMISEAEVTPATMALMHRATGAALGLTVPGVRTPARVATAAPRAAAAATASAGASRPGSIGALILQVLAAEPSRAFSVTDLAKELGRGSGAVGAAFAGILTRGEARLASEFPRRIQALTTGPGAVVQADAADGQDLDAEDADVEVDDLDTEEAETGQAQVEPQEVEAPAATGRRKAPRP